MSTSSAFMGWAHDKGETFAMLKVLKGLYTVYYFKVCKTKIILNLASLLADYTDHWTLYMWFNMPLLTHWHKVI